MNDYHQIIKSSIFYDQLIPCPTYSPSNLYWYRGWHADLPIAVPWSIPLDKQYIDCDWFSSLVIPKKDFYNHQFFSFMSRTYKTQNCWSVVMREGSKTYLSVFIISWRAWMTPRSSPLRTSRSNEINFALKSTKYSSQSILLSLFDSAREDSQQVVCWLYQSANCRSFLLPNEEEEQCDDFYDKSKGKWTTSGECFLLAWIEPTSWPAPCLDNAKRLK